MKKDNDVDNFLKQKNDEILYNKLLLDIMNNDDSLKLTLKCKVELISSKLQFNLNHLLKQYDISYDLKQLDEFVSFSKEKIIGFLEEETAKRKENNILLANREFNLDNSYDCNEEKIKISEDLNYKLNPIIYVDMVSNFFNKFRFSSEESKNEVIEKCFKKYDFDLSNQIVDSFFQRNITLKNMMAETRRKYNELNANTIGTYSKNKEKVISEKI